MQTLASILAIPFSASNLSGQKAIDTNLHARGARHNTY